MYYEINVSRNTGAGYTHLFATHERSLTTLDAALKVYHLLVKAFPEPEYKIDITRWDTRGMSVDIAQFKK